MKFVTALLVFFSIASASADQKIKMYYTNEEITKIIEMYSKATGQKFIIDPGVRGRISIFNQESISVEEAFDQMSNALALNGFAISKQGDIMVVQSARNAQRNFLEVSTERPSMKPQRMYTWIFKAKNLSALQINRDLRILPSKDGEMNVDTPNNQIIITDWVTNINRVADILAKIDIPEDPATAKIVKKAQTEMKAKKDDKLPRINLEKGFAPDKGFEKNNE